jgi:beta-glucanase (GH16 family)
MKIPLLISLALTLPVMAPAQTPAGSPTTASAAAPATPAAPTTPITPYGDVVQNYALSWSDEFNGPAVDSDKWQYRTDSKMWSTQQAANVSISDGKLVIALKDEHVDNKSYTGGGIISKRTFEYGYYEARFKVPPGSGWHTSFWTMAYNNANTKPEGTQEIDICEQDSVHTTKYSAGVIAWGNHGAGHGRKYVKTPDLAADFHVWGCEFTPTVVKFFFDGKLTHQTEATNFKQGPQNIWLTCIACGLGGTKFVDNSKLPATAEFDYVRFFESPDVAAK